MAERPILFSAPMVRAILADQKTQTRRVVKLVGSDTIEEREDGSSWPYCVTWAHGDDGEPWYACPYGEPGDRLWVKEAYALSHRDDNNTEATPKDRDAWDWPPVYRADGENQGGGWTRRMPGGVECRIAPPWRPSIHMPRWASRLTLEVTSVRVERLQDITEDDARAEGVDWSRPEPYGERWDDDREDPREVGYPPAGASFARDNFRRLWSSINGPESWASDAWVWVVGFKRVEVRHG